MEKILELVRAARFGQGAALLGLFAVLSVIFLQIRKIIWKRLGNFTSRTRVTWDDEALAAISAPVKVALVLFAAALIVQFAPQSFSKHLSYLVNASFVLASAWGVYRFLDALLRSASSPVRVSETTRALLLTAMRAIVGSITILLVLENLGVSITPILASLGVGSVAVALALQDTLSNFFGGIYLLIDEPIRIGDFIQTENGTEGYVVKIGWRSTHVRLLANNIVVIPNSKMASQRLTNFDLIEKETSILVEVSVSYESDLSKVERVTCEVAKEIMTTVDGGVSSFDPFIRFHTFNNSGIDFTVILRSREITGQYLLKHEFIKALHKRYAQEGITIPFPQSVVHLARDEAMAAVRSVRNTLPVE